MNGKRWAALGIAAALFVVSVFTSFASSILSGNFQTFMDEFIVPAKPYVEEVVEEGNSFNRIAVLELNGIIQDSGNTSTLLQSETYNHRLFMDQLEYAKEDTSIKGIILRVNTPGGGVVESAEIHDKIVEIMEEAKKPVYISMGSMAASGGYYIAAPAEKIFAAPNTLTGSLGVIMQNVNYKELADKIGIDYVTIKSGPYKDIMSQTREMTEEERDILYSMLNNTYEGFVKVISEGRGMSEEEVRRIADGRVYDGIQAKELNLIDDFGYLQDVIKQMKKDYKLNNAQVVRFTEYAGFSSLFSLGAQKMMGNDLQLTNFVNALSEPNSPRLMYLYTE
ncbi:signal peptide peptidase SppA [Bacillus aquiflavi]|uniref:Signal peptide peptidase SppA n=1 Tax=Bacillus aquiflavi TaxID=2672567 RepID=A0A6B3VVX5_9BACI|nr:signal peptide peptidase SppA [Bacillus aquiflavi]MBA4537953.1 signal peptide peptidase SppA [Bacillus aquiflavi]NEY82209.1 signal peptide peptidase SppA [Bacillus aquiflavi]UAC47566.1 signal peptide peptidase SppA [Bacillus aquiflavi]